MALPIKSQIKYWGVAAAVFGLVSVVGVVHWLPRALVVGNGFPPLAAALLSAGVFAWYAAWFAALPLAVAIADVYNTIRMDTVDRLPKESARLTAQIIVFMALAAALLWLITEQV